MKPGRFLLSVMVMVGLTLGLTISVLGQEIVTHTVKEGDTLKSIALRYYKDENVWPKLWEINRDNMTNPHRLTVGDELFIYPQQTLVKTLSPPPPMNVTKSNYDRGLPLVTEFPKYFTFVADPRGIGASGISRVKVKKLDPVTKETIVTYDEVREVGEIIASTDRGYEWELDKPLPGKIMLTYNDEVIVRFTDDLAKILDSATWEDPDPYFREFPIYGFGQRVREPNACRADYGLYLGNIHQLKGRLQVIARVETLAPVDMDAAEDNAILARRRQRAERHRGVGVDVWPVLPDRQRKPYSAWEARANSISGRNANMEPVSYVCKISYAEKPIQVGDRIFVFKSILPGPDRVPCEQKLHEVGKYRPPDF